MTELEELREKASRYNELENSKSGAAAIDKMECHWRGHVWDYSNNRARGLRALRSTCVRCGVLLEYPPAK